MLKKISIYLLFLCMYCMTAAVWASHLIGGNMGYEYMGLQPGGKYRYKVKLTTYIDCSPGSEIPYAEHPLKVGVYAHNLATPLANKPLVDSLLLYVQDTTVYEPFLGPGCTVGANTCIIQVNYVGYIDLAPSPSGYHLFYERCCRNLSIINLNLPQSSAFMAYIPPTNIVNSSPDFLYPPIPFLCISDTVTILNTATDVDGDSLVYSFTVPYNGFGSSSDPLPDLPSPALTWPVPPVDYVPGFSASTPFSFFGNATMNAQDGVAEYYSMQLGSYVIAVLVQEYRNGLLISSVIRELQVIFLNCPNNYPPELVDNLQKEYTVTVGDTLCFPITFRDPENDSVFMEATGDIFDPAIIDTPAVFTITSIDTNQASGDFCWKLPCDIDTGTYKFYMHSYDNGCPPKDQYEFYKIHIIPAEMPHLLGSDSACKNTDSVVYWMAPDRHYQYQWNIVNGTIIQDLGDSVVVSWGSPDSGKVLVDVYTANGCYVGSDSMDVTLIDIPNLLAMDEDTICPGDTILLTAIGVDPYYWYPETHIIGPIQGNTEAIVESSTWFYVAGLPGQLCPPSDSVLITTFTKPLVAATANDTNLCEGDTLILSGTGTGDLAWKPENQVAFPDSAVTYAYPDSSMDFILVVTDTNQCNNYDTVHVEFHPAPVLNLDAVPELCAGDTAIFTASGGIMYQWSPHADLSSDTGAIVLAYPGNTVIYTLVVTDTNGCMADTSFTLDVHPSPNAAFDVDTLNVDCDGTWMQFMNTSTGADGYQWTFGNGNQSTEIDPMAVFPFGQTFTVQLIAINGQCSSDTSVQITTDPVEHFTIFDHINIITPDGDGMNDSLDFHFPAYFKDCTRVEVYDRWGMPMFAADNNGISWDGSTGGKRVPEGVYYWTVEMAGRHFAGFVHVFK